MRVTTRMRSGRASRSRRRSPCSAGRSSRSRGSPTTRSGVDGFTEAGTTVLGLAGRSRSVDALRGHVGARAFVDLPFDGLVVTPELRARLVYDFLDDARALNATFVADPTQTPFTTTGVSPDRTAGLIGAALTVRLGEAVSAFASYDAELRGGDAGHLVRGGLRIRW